MALRLVGVIGLSVALVACDGNSTPTSRLQIAVVGNGRTTPSAGEHDHATGTTVTVTAVPARGARFVGWSGAATTSVNPVDVVVIGEKTLVAHFRGGAGIDGGDADQTVSISAGGSGAGAFGADAYFSGGRTYSTTSRIDLSLLSGEVPPASVFQTERFGAFTYTIPNRTPGSRQRVILYFAESIRTAAGQRTFDVVINGAKVLTRFDIFEAAGGMNKAVARSFDTTASASGQVVIEFVDTGPDLPKVCAITVETR
jgi:hypothetical protein